ncbi:MAG: flagellar assembly protein T N-terminal domain-containing protein [Candidatus Methylomirabilis oxyfera]|nr:flagellar assembly protein T N-terminal domain-containing protein [Candidatus Methylomirabilis oxyfera]
MFPLIWRRVQHRRGHAFAVVILLMLIWAPVASAEMITAEGVVAVTGENMAIFREKAIDDALRRAVEQAVGTMVSSDTMTNNFQVVHDKILAQTSGYVKSYQIIKEGRVGQEFRVTVMADVGRDNLQRTLEALGLLHELKEKPKVMVIIEEKVGGLFGTTAWENVGQAESTLMERLVAAGFTVVDPATVRANIPRDKALRLLEGDPKAAATAGLQYGAQVVITGRAFSKNAGGRLLGTQMQSIQATLQARAIRADDGRVISSRSDQGAKAHIDEMQGGALAIKEASEKLSDAMVNDILKSWKKDVYGRSQEITLIISGLVSYRHLSAVKTFLEKGLQGVKAVHQRNFTQGTAELQLDYAGKTSLIADELSNKQFTGFRLEPTNVTPNRLDVRAVIDR